MKLQWCKVLLCTNCAAGKPQECTTPGCVVWSHRMGFSFGNEHTIQPLTVDQVNAIDAARAIAKGDWVS